MCVWKPRICVRNKLQEQDDVILLSDPQKKERERELHFSVLAESVLPLNCVIFLCSNYKKPVSVIYTSFWRFKLQFFIAKKEKHRAKKKKKNSGFNIRSFTLAVGTQFKSWESLTMLTLQFEDIQWTVFPLYLSSIHPSLAHHCDRGWYQEQTASFIKLQQPVSVSGHTLAHTRLCFLSASKAQPRDGLTFDDWLLANWLNIPRLGTVTFPKMVAQSLTHSQQLSLETKRCFSFEVWPVHRFQKVSKVLHFSVKVLLLKWHKQCLE